MKDPIQPRSAQLLCAHSPCVCVRLCGCVPGSKGERIKTDGGGAGEREQEINCVCLQNESKGLLYLRLVK